MTQARRIAIVGAGMAGISCARTLVQAGHQVTVFEQDSSVGGRMATHSSAFGSFDPGAQYFTVRDARFELALSTVPGLARRWSANAVQVLDPHGLVVEAALPAREPHWVAKPGMNTLLQAWAKPLLDSGAVELHTSVVALEKDSLNARQWQLRTNSTDGGSHVFGGYDAVLLAIPGPQASALLKTESRATKLAAKVAKSTVAPCWTLMLAFPQAVQPGLTTLGPQWNAARSTHHRIAWLARESSKPGRSAIERWTVQASASWSQEHLQDDAKRVTAKLIKAFTEVTGIRAEPAYTEVQRWLHAKTDKPLGESHLWDSKAGIGVCGDWCLGHRVEDAFVSGLEMALAIA